MKSIFYIQAVANDVHPSKSCLISGVIQINSRRLIDWAWFNVSTNTV